MVKRLVMLRICRKPRKVVLFARDERDMCEVFCIIVIIIIDMFRFCMNIYM